MSRPGGVCVIGPSKPSRVAASANAPLWPDWQSFVQVGQQYQAHAPAGTHFFDSGSNRVADSPVEDALIGPPFALLALEDALEGLSGFGPETRPTKH